MPIRHGNQCAELCCVITGILIIALAAVYSIKLLADSFKCCVELCPCLLPGSAKKHKESTELSEEANQSSPLKKSGVNTGSYS